MPALREGTTRLTLFMTVFLHGGIGLTPRGNLRPQILRDG
jgi:hypothetical protein